MKKTINVFINLLTIGTLIMSCGSKESSQKQDVAIISTKYGDMVVEFFDEHAPKHVESFKMHSQNGYYNGTIFHRVIPGFVIQGGDPNSKSEDRGMHGICGNAAKYFGVGDERDSTTWSIPAEFNSLKHQKGILSMARANDPNSAGSQFFICAGNVNQLDNNYTVFGKVIKGLTIIDQIVNVPRDGRDNPNDRIEMTVRLEQREK